MDEWILARSPEHIAEIGDRFNEHADKDGCTPRMIIAAWGFDHLRSFRLSGGHFYQHSWQDRQGRTAGHYVVMCSGSHEARCAAIYEFALAGGRFTDLEDHDGHTAGDLATLYGVKLVYDEAIARDGLLAVFSPKKVFRELCPTLSKYMGIKTSQITPLA